MEGIFHIKKHRTAVNVVRSGKLMLMLFSIAMIFRVSHAAIDFSDKLTELHIAVIDDDVNKVSEIIKTCVRTDGFCKQIDEIGQFSLFDETGRFYSSGNQATPLIMAAYFGHREIAELLIKEGASLDAVGYIAERQGGTRQRGTALGYSARLKDVRLLKLLINEGADINNRGKKFKAAAGQDCYVDTPLMHAASSGNLKAFKILLSHGADIHLTDCNREGVLHRAAENGQFEIFRYALELGLDINGGYVTPLMEATRSGNLDLVKYIVSKGADLNAVDRNMQNALRYALSYSSFETTKFLVDSGIDCTSNVLKNIPLKKRIKNKRERLNDDEYLAYLSVLLDGASKIEIKDIGGAFKVASNESYRKSIVYLLKRFGSDKAFHPYIKKAIYGYGVSGQTSLLGQDLIEYVEKHADLDAWNALLMRAINEGDEALIDLFIKKGANIDYVNEYGDTPLLMAIDNRKKRIIYILLQKGANPNVRRKGPRLRYLHETPLIEAVCNGDMDVVKWLVQHGADVNTKDLKSKDALAYASDLKRSKIEKVLREAGAKNISFADIKLSKLRNVEGERYYQNREYQKAERLFKEAISLNYNNVEALSNLSVVFIRNGKPKESVENSEMIVSGSFPQEVKASAYYNLGKACQLYLGNKKLTSGSQVGDYHISVCSRVFFYYYMAWYIDPNRARAEKVLENWTYKLSNQDTVCVSDYDNIKKIRKEPSSDRWHYIAFCQYSNRFYFLLNDRRLINKSVINVVFNDSANDNKVTLHELSVNPGIFIGHFDLTGRSNIFHGATVSVRYNVSSAESENTLSCESRYYAH